MTDNCKNSPPGSSNESRSIFEGSFWKSRIHSDFLSADIVFSVFWLLFCFPFLVLLTERSKGDRLELRLSELFTITSLLGLAISFEINFGRFYVWLIGSLLSIAAGVLVGVIIAIFARRPSWILVSTSLFFFTGILLRLLALLGLF